METCTAIESVRDSLIWIFFHTTYYPRVTFWGYSAVSLNTGFSFKKDSCD